MAYVGKSRYLDFDSLADPSERFKLGSVIGVGTYGEVYEATDNENGNRKVAIKILERLEAHIVEVEEEYRILKDLSNHSNFPTFYGAFLKKSRNSDEDQLWFAIELCGGGSASEFVQSLLQRGKKMQESHIAYILRETIKAVQHLHMNHVMHRDIKGTNILLTDGGDVKLVDFGISRHIKKTMDKRNTAIGTPYWMAPEVIACDQKPEEGYDNRSDVWSLGITAIEFGDGTPPLSEVHPTRAMFQIVHNPPPMLKTWTEWSGDYNDFISECLVKNPEHRPVMMELIEHPFMQLVPENENALKSELVALLDQGWRKANLTRTQEVTRKAGYLKMDRKSKLQKIYFDDLCGIDKPEEQGILDQLQHRFFAGNTYTFMGDILISVNPHGEMKKYTEADHMRYASKCRSDEAPHVFAVADRAWQDMMHHKEHQNVVFTGETCSGKSYCFNLALEHLITVAKSNPGISQKLRSASRIIDMFANAPTAFNENSTRHVKLFELTFSKTGKLSGALIWSYMFEKWRVSNFNLRNNGNFHILYYFYCGMDKQGLLSRYSLQSKRDYKFLPDHKYLNIDKYIDGFKEFEGHMKHFDFVKAEMELIYKSISAVILLGDIEFENGEFKDEESAEMADKVAKLLSVDSKKFQWVLLNYCQIVRGEPVRKRYSDVEAYEARDAVARMLYARLFDWMVNALNLKISVTRLVFGDPHAIGLLDMFGFECTENNSYEQLVVNTTNEQILFHFNQSTFGWEMQDCKQEGLDVTNYTFFDNRPTLDTLLMKPEGVFAFLDEECKGKGDPSSFVSSLNEMSSKYLDVKSNIEFAIAHYAGKITYFAEDFITKNRDFVSPEVVELLRTSQNTTISTIYKLKMTKTGHVTTAATSQEKALVRRFNTLSKGKFSQVRQLQTQNQVLRHSLIEILQRLVSGSSHYVRCLSPNTKGSPDLFDRAMVQHQMKAMGFLETIKVRQTGFSCRVNFKEFLRRYQFLAFDFDENVDVTPDNCRLLLVRLKIDGWAIGKNKIFMRYYAEEYLSRLYETQVKKIVKIQAMMRSYLARKRKRQQGIQGNRNGYPQGSQRPGPSGARGKGPQKDDRYNERFVTQDEAAVEIQRNFRGYQARKEYRPLMDKSRFRSETIEEEAVNIIQYYFRKWKTRSMFQQLMLYRQQKQQQLIHFCQQVHLYNQEACGHQRKFNRDISFYDIRPVKRGTHKDVFKPIVPKANKLPFGNKNLYFLDTTFMCVNAGINAFKKGGAGKQERDVAANARNRRPSDEWDEPIKKRSPFPHRTDATESERSNERYERPKSLAPSYNRFAGAGPAVKQPQSFVPSPTSGMKSPNSPRSPVVQYSQYGGNGGQYNKLRTSRNDSTEDEGRVRPPSHVEELRERARGGNDDAPFNFQGMLKKTQYSRSSMKRNAPPVPGSGSDRLSVPGANYRRSVSLESPSRHEIAPGIVLEGQEAEL